MSAEWKQIIANIKEWVKEAGAEQVKRLDQPMEVKSKSSTIDLVTEVDVWTDEFLRQKIKASYPDHSILTEEQDFHEGASDYEWVVDPIDGTVNYAHQFPMFCISVALKYKGETVIGVVYAPKLGECYEAMKGEGAYLNGNPISVSQTDNLKAAVVATGFPYDRATDPQNNVKEFNAVILKVGGVRRTGSAAIDLCQVASGRFDGYWEYKINPWDFEAGLLLVQEAGGKVQKVKQEKGYFVLVGNEPIYTELQDLL
ncbi:inositol monophosphatase family protein [Desertibacillus haloalkaliphilus]|uniref:inositol monophosphatase family protein n=1 Tax=Desertibacillus haloalkaliphilus TaxID=1328930 RepID=UPI001C26CC6B|nr:inositol monophosphatase family protein [Desertibacillus haloalkaliphilus]MBU8905315.1 inositol monophosphatase [Desertibacillus haloalkaliphilus]